MTDLTVAFVKELRKRGVRGLARAADVSPTYVSRIKGGHEPVPGDGKLADFLRRNREPLTQVELLKRNRQLQAEINDLREQLEKALERKRRP